MAGTRRKAVSRGFQFSDINTACESRSPIAFDFLIHTVPDAKTGVPDMTLRYARNCFVYDRHQWLNQGCVAVDTDGDSLGQPLNRNGGGVYALEWGTSLVDVSCDVSKLNQLNRLTCLSIYMNARPSESSYPNVRLYASHDCT